MNYLDDFTKAALKEWGHEATKEQARRLKDDGELCGTKCTECGEIAFPARSHCPSCFHQQTEFVPIGKGARLYAFTTQTRGLRFRKPHVVGIVEIPDVGLVVSPIEGTMDTLQIGQSMVPQAIEAGAGLPFYKFAAG